MILTKLEEIKQAQAPGTRLLGIDAGEKTLGLALSDSALKIATPLETIRRSKFRNDALKLRQLCDERQVGGLLLGLPVNMDGSEGPRCQSVRQLAANLAGQGFPEPIAFWDERLSTAAVERFLIDEADLSRQRRAQVVDKMAAAYILQGALDFLAGR